MNILHLTEFPPNRRRFLKQGIALGALAGLDPLASIIHGATTIATGKTVEISSGKVRGTVHDGISAFKGIPYGAPTGGKMRFMAPAKPASWAGRPRLFHIWASITAEHELRRGACSSGQRSGGRLRRGLSISECLDS